MKPIEQYIAHYDNVISKNLPWERISPMLEAYFKDCDFYQFSWEQLKHLGFSTWDDADTLLLIPSYFFNCITEGTKVKDINDKILSFEKSFDDDTRYGYLGYGLMKEEWERIKTENRNNNIDNLIK